MHILRNALGGADRGLSEKLYTMKGQERRKFKVSSCFSAV